MLAHPHPLVMASACCSLAFGNPCCRLWHPQPPPPRLHGGLAARRRPRRASQPGGPCRLLCMAARQEHSKQAARCIASQHHLPPSPAPRRAPPSAPVAACSCLAGGAATPATPRSCATCGTTAACLTPWTWATRCERCAVPRGCAWPLWCCQAQVARVPCTCSASCGHKDALIPSEQRLPPSLRHLPLQEPCWGGCGAHLHHLQ